MNFKLLIPFVFSLLCAFNLQAEDYKKPSKDELKKSLTPQQYSCTQEAGTEAPFKNPYWNNHADGIYVDVVSSDALFSSLDKYDSGTGWPSFKKPIEDESVTTKSDSTLGIGRTEVRSKKADSHLGHVFNDGPGPTKKRYCINSASLKFVPYSEMLSKGYGNYLYLFVEKKKQEIALLAGGCFWGVQELFRKRPGVIYSEVGYTGGDEEGKGQYEDVHTGTTGHAEAVRIIFDPKVTNYTDILLYFFNIHNPTTLDQQGNDIGSQYRSEIFYLTASQKKIASKVIARVDKSKKWVKPVVTKLSQAKKFMRGEENHQDYLQKHPGGYTCHFPRNFTF